MTTTAAWILDASVAAKWYLRDEQLLNQADRILDQFGEGMIGLAAPAYLHDEVANILRTGVRRSRLTAEHATQAYASFLALEIVVIDATVDRRAASFALALHHDIAYYDALYLQVAMELRLPLLTADRPFFDKIAGTFPAASHLGDL